MEWDTNGIHYQTLRYINLVCAPFSLVGCLFIIIAFGLSFNVKKGSVHLAFFQAVSDFFLAMCFFVTGLMDDPNHYSTNRDPKESINPETGCVVLGALSQFFSQVMPCGCG